MMIYNSDFFATARRRSGWLIKSALRPKVEPANSHKLAVRFSDRLKVAV
jgi:hypothetical protein